MCEESQTYTMCKEVKNISELKETRTKRKNGRKILQSIPIRAAVIFTKGDDIKY